MNEQMTSKKKDWEKLRRIFIFTDFAIGSWNAFQFSNYKKRDWSPNHGLHRNGAVLVRSTSTYETKDDLQVYGGIYFSFSLNNAWLYVNYENDRLSGTYLHSDDDNNSIY